MNRPRSAHQHGTKVLFANDRIQAARFWSTRNELGEVVVWAENPVGDVFQVEVDEEMSRTNQKPNRFDFIVYRPINETVTQ